MKCVLMHKRFEVAELSIDEIYGNFLSVEKINFPEHFPLGVYRNGMTDIHELNDWWKGRSIPASRNGLQETLDKLGEPSIMSLVLKSYGLSLSDHYWMKPVGMSIEWDDINYFDNEFSEDIGNLLFGGELENKVDFHSPDNTSDGWLKKRWKISNNERIMLKGGSNPFQQEPLNEVIASRFMNNLGVNCVTYNIVWQDGYPYCVCSCFVTKDTELIPAARLMKIKKKPNHENTFQHLVSCCNEVGVEAVPFLDRMLTVDYILANEDRHFTNFGLLRNPETLQFIGFAPIYDSGSSLCYNRNQRKFNDYEMKPFYSDCDRQAELITSFQWFDTEKANCIFRNIEEVLGESVVNGFMTSERVQHLKQFVELKMNHILALMEHKIEVPKGIRGERTSIRGFISQAKGGSSAINGNSNHSSLGAGQNGQGKIRL